VIWHLFALALSFAFGSVAVHDLKQGWHYSALFYGLLAIDIFVLEVTEKPGRPRVPGVFVPRRKAGGWR